MSVPRVPKFGGKTPSKRMPPTRMQRMRGKASLVIGKGTIDAARAKGGEKSILKNLYQSGNAKLRFPERDDHFFEAVMINSAGGSTGGDSLEWQIDLEADSNAILTTQACEKIYAALEGEAVDVKVTIKLDEGAQLWWLPQETILFNKSALNRKITVNMADHCQLLMVESLVFGRHLMGEVVESGLLHDQWQIYVNDRLVHMEALHLDNNIAQKLAHNAFLNENLAMANLVFIDDNLKLPLGEQSSENDALMHALKDIIEPLGGISCWNGKLLARLVDKNSYYLRKRLIKVINLLTNEAGVPKIWSI